MLKLISEKHKKADYTPISLIGISIDPKLTTKRKEAVRCTILTKFFTAFSGKIR